MIYKLRLYLFTAKLGIILQSTKHYSKKHCFIENLIAMKVMDKAKVQDILKEEDKQGLQVRQNIARQLDALKYGAIMWGESVFGSTNYPEISDEMGHTYNVHGLRLNLNGGVCAIIDYPTGEYITGVKGYSQDEAEKLITPSMLICSGMPEEWEVLGDCMSTAIQILKGENEEKQPLPWW